jgi:hypothetical protein
MLCSLKMQQQKASPNFFRRESAQEHGHHASGCCNSLLEMVLDTTHGSGAVIG